MAGRSLLLQGIRSGLWGCCSSTASTAGQHSGLWASCSSAATTAIQHVGRFYASAAAAAAAEAAALPEHEDDYATIHKKGITLHGLPLYLDMQATTPVDPRVMDAMLPYLCDQFGNPHSRTHLYGWESEEAVEAARAQVYNITTGSRVPYSRGTTNKNKK